MFGVAWVFLNPLIMLAIFAYVFGQIFQARWPQQETGAPFWLVFYSGLIAFNIFAEAVSRAPASVRGTPSYVKKIRSSRWRFSPSFPLARRSSTAPSTSLFFWLGLREPGTLRRL